MLLSCVIATKNRPESVQRLLDSIAFQDAPPDEVVIVNDGGDHKGLVDALKLHDLKVIFIENQPSLGSGRARNLGVARSQGAVILLLDDDVEMTTVDFISQGRQAMADEKVGLAFPRKIDVMGHKSFELSFFAESKMTGELRGIDQKDAKSGGVVASLDGEAILGPMVCFVRRKAFEEVGGYDFIFGRGRGHSFREESDFQLRVQERGWRVVILKDIFFKHHIQITGGHGTNMNKKLFWIAHNQVIFGARHQKNWMRKAILFAGLELPRYSWGNGRFLTYPAGLLGWGVGVASSVAHSIRGALSLVTKSRITKSTSPRK